ncbi:sodium:proton antiporter NhaD [Niabella ginsengisoli]|uniref:Sodium:proton antiporter NhaD n=1 Tax=Niabella ginsengisoli TaxID=522298 RepID=A0ABS9SL96_9BACT|nr:sodium:proton antiporter NhaD [Niabella ginsengisoli]MCH5599158.1 sodium:proton antiporter NhaD [Niabella ginsengisoli]
MITAAIIIIFVLGYLAIAMEHVTKVNKAAPALITGVLCWTIYLYQSGDNEAAVESLLHHLGDISSILFFLLGAMTIVELIDAHDGFDIITERITTRSKKKLLYIISFLSFFLSALLDNLTTSIVMVSLCAKLLQQKEDRLWFASMIIIAANAGGAWSPLGDVTTTMLWIGGQITALNIMKTLIIPSVAVCLLPTLIIGYRFKKEQTAKPLVSTTTERERRHGKIVLASGIGSLIFVPIFKTVTHLPPFMGMMMMVGFMWIVTTLIHKRKKTTTISPRLLKK